MLTTAVLAAEPAHADDDPLRSSGHSAAELWELIKDINEQLRQTTRPSRRTELAWRRASAWEQLTILAVDAGDPPWYAAACACISEVSTEAAERIEARRQPKLPL
jgi:glucose-6-phosphate dehydrogenase assembly protein OpcA